jgi:hypothetical protein
MFGAPLSRSPQLRIWQTSALLIFGAPTVVTSNPQPLAGGSPIVSAI